MNASASRAYLLGLLADAEVEAVEARLLDDADLFSQMETAEDDLFDAFARGRLSADERARFLQRFGAEASRRRFARAFAQRTQAGRVGSLARRWWEQVTSLRRRGR